VPGHLFPGATSPPLDLGRASVLASPDFPGTHTGSSLGGRSVPHPNGPGSAPCCHRESACLPRRWAHNHRAMKRPRRPRSTRTSAPQRRPGHRWTLEQDRRAIPTPQAGHPCPPRPAASALDCRRGRLAPARLALGQRPPPSPSAQGRRTCLAECARPRAQQHAIQPGRAWSYRMSLRPRTGALPR
jgi:hypothetical protein